MCDRFVRISTRREFAQAFALPGLEDQLAYTNGTVTPSWNVAPGQRTWVIRNRNTSTSPALFDTAEWGFLPNWATEDLSKRARPGNTDAEKAPNRHYYAMPYRHQRCVVPANGYYEWRTVGEKRQPWFVRLASGAPVALAGLWDSWGTGKPGAMLTFAILTTKSNGEISRLHHRIPVILDPDQIEAWLDPKLTEAKLVSSMIRGRPAQCMEAWPVSKRVNNKNNDGAGLVETVASQ